MRSRNKDRREGVSQTKRANATELESDEYLEVPLCESIHPLHSMSITSILSQWGVSPTECQAVARKLKENFATETLEQFAQMALIDMYRKLGIPEARLRLLISELMKEDRPSSQSPSALFAFPLLGPPPARYPTNVGFLCDPGGFQYVSFGDDDVVPRFTRQVRDTHPSHTLSA